jgi:predicted RNA-binding protein associated with RNAse of E/G family
VAVTSEVIQFEYRRPGKRTVVYHELLVLDRGDVKVLLQEHYPGDDIAVGSHTILERAAPIVWFVVVGSWHDIGRFHRSDGTFTGWYTNLSKPVAMSGNHWVGSDLFLDLWQPVDGDPVWLDEGEFADAATKGLVDSVTKKRALNERALIDLQVHQAAWPPAIARDIDLKQIERLLAS